MVQNVAKIPSAHLSGFRIFLNEICLKGGGGGGLIFIVLGWGNSKKLCRRMEGVLGDFNMLQLVKSRQNARHGFITTKPN